MVYDEMTDEQLRQILRKDAQKTEGEEKLDLERLLYIMKVLAERRKKRNEEKDPYIAWESFKKYYASEDDNWAYFYEKFCCGNPKRKNQAQGLEMRYGRCCGVCATCGRFYYDGSKNAHGDTDAINAYRV